jgi:hypothetical protein
MVLRFSCFFVACSRNNWGELAPTQGAERTAENYSAKRPTS